MQIEIPLRSAVTVTIDPERHVLCITDREADVPVSGSGQSHHVWLSREQHSTGRNRFNQISQEHEGYTFEKLVGRLLKRKVVWVATIGLTCFLGFMYARHSGSSHQRAMIVAQEQLHTLPTPDTTPSLPGTPLPSVQAPTQPLPASPNAAFGLD
ncbi:MULTISPECIES: hypothetical protein [Asaia]|uniref:Uncharacterized protein n=1 Tax=Asaia spathodeae TaxID=657016 RepID=A0ABX2P825_9PROT|nr:hypothetical protein [Asaia spathodeae]GBR20193.1 hypothetical protein AA105894_2497 [Asaia spathodeae NBRC 105894]